MATASGVAVAVVVLVDDIMVVAFTVGVTDIPVTGSTTAQPVNNGSTINIKNNRRKRTGNQAS
jgi:hypothetical protein